MKFVNPNDGGLVWPAESVTHTISSDGALLDTGWLINWPGPGNVYLSDNDLVDVVIPAAKERAAVQEALVSAGWTKPGDQPAHEAELAALHAKVAEAEKWAKALEERLAHLGAEKPKAAAKKKAA